MRNRTYIIMNSSVDSDAVGVFYYPMGQATFQAQRQSFLTGIFVSLPIDGSSSLTQWSKILWDATLPTGSSLSVFTRSAASVDALSSSAWNGPLYNSSGESLSSYHGRYIQVKIVLSGIGWTNNTLIGVTPVVQSFSVQGIVSGSEEKMYTKAFDLGFVPKYFIMTYNGKIPADTLLSVAVAGDDTTELSRYINVKPNRVQSLENLPDLAGKVKLMIRAMGSQLAPFEINKIGFFVSGDRQTLLNK